MAMSPETPRSSSPPCAARGMLLPDDEGADGAAAPPACEFLVLKFGGTSVSSAANWRRIAAIVKQRLAGSDSELPTKILIVHSALSKVTDKLHACLEQAVERKRDSGGTGGSGAGFRDASQPAGRHRATLEDIVAQHMALAEDMGIARAEAELLLNPYRKELQRILEGASLIAEVSPRTKARVVAMGELLSTTLGAAFLQEALSDEGGCMWLEARELLRSTNEATGGLLQPPDELTFLNAGCEFSPRPSLQRQVARAAERLFITQGFIAANANGDTVLLGRGGSDTSASYFACVLEARRLEIWTDVPGMFTANPRMESKARLLRTLSFEEAQELASAGAKVLHPRCIGPVMKYDIPIMVCDTFRPQLEGTVISSRAQDKGVVKAVAVRHGIPVVNLDHGMRGQIGFLADVFKVFKAQSISIDLVSTSKNSVTLSLDPETVVTGAMELVTEELSKFCKVTVYANCGSVSLVGAQIRAALASVAPALMIFRNFKVHMMTQAANDLNLTFVVDDEHAEPIATELHNLYSRTVNSPRTFGKTWTSLALLDKRQQPMPDISLNAMGSGPCNSPVPGSPSRGAPAPADVSHPIKVGIVGWRGMVGSVLLQRMIEENDYDGSFEAVFFSTSQVGEPGPDITGGVPLSDAMSVAALGEMAIILTCQGGEYSKEMHPKLRNSGWNGYWVDAASALRTESNAVIVLDPINRAAIDAAMDGGVIRDFVGGNCTVSLMLMALGGLFEKGWVQSVQSMTYQSASGAGARHMRELVQQMNQLGQCIGGDQAAAAAAAAGDGAAATTAGPLELAGSVHDVMQQDSFPTEQFRAPLAGSLLPFIDKQV
jgi:aspartate kinase